MPRLVVGLLALALLGPRVQALQLLPKTLDAKGAREVADQVVANVIARDTDNLFKRGWDAARLHNILDRGIHKRCARAPEVDG